ncbi:PREDICTED: 39S ribosomal protein L53, mitochondrial [Dipodomys ordii]|uniref:39S ribosomal protein L53, mitochondrial n=1 Tax=Dipodomys ordii TaxID=10020 RepID=A0A1S3GMX6_DIPOR|nr:PREDICTED: 39S ribosomal protein L53, mitochondrial [Dipodomys ordii]
MAAAMARLGLRCVKQVRVQFCPFERDGHRLILRGAHLTAQEMFTAFASHVQARSAEDGADKPGGR